MQTPGYRAPEALLYVEPLPRCNYVSLYHGIPSLHRLNVSRRRCSFGANIDVWSIGVVLVELLMAEKLVPEDAGDVQTVCDVPCMMIC